MPCYNARQHIPASVASVLGQTETRMELITVDDGSSDDTAAWLKAQSDPRIKVIQQSNHGVSEARNAGLAQARGHFVAFLDADDLWEPIFLERMLSAHIMDPGIGLVYCGWQNVGLPGKRGAPFVPPDYETPDKKATLLASNRWPIHACMTKRALVTAAGGFDSRFAVGEDFLLWLEIACFQRIRRVPEVLAYYVHHNGIQATRDRVRASRQLLDVQRTFLKRHPEIATELGRERIRKLTDGMLLARGYEAYWRRDLDTAQSIFRMALKGGGWGTGDLRHLLLALLPPRIYRHLVSLADKHSSEAHLE